MAGNPFEPDEEESEKWQDAHRELYPDEDDEVIPAKRSSKRKRKKKKRQRAKGKAQRKLRPITISGKKKICHECREATFAENISKSGCLACQVTHYFRSQ